jgi:hypothetical protein
MIAKDSYSASISRFMRYAQDRLDQEIEQIERCEEEFGAAEVYKEKKETRPKDLTVDQKRDLFDQVNKLYDLHPHLSRASACEEVGLHYTTYYKWKGELS